MAARLQQLQQEGAAKAQDADAPPRNPVRLAFLVSVLILVLGAGWVVSRRLAAPPPSRAAQRLSDGTWVRLLEVTAAAPHTYQYTPPDDPLRRLAERVGLRPGWPAMSVANGLAPGDGITLWLQVARPLEVQQERVEFRSDDGAVYRDGGPDSVARQLATISAGTEVWGRGSLVWVTLGNFDHGARRLTAVVPLGQAGDAAEFTIDGPARPAPAWDVTAPFPLTAGNKEAVVRLQQLRPAQPEVTGMTLDGQPPPEPADEMLLADLDVTEPPGVGESGFWHLQIDEAVTRQGERLGVVRDSAGLAWLSRGRPAAGIDAIRLKVSAEKRIRGMGLVVFRNLTLPEVGKSAVWNTTVDGPFPGAQFVAQTCSRPSADRMLVTIDGRAPTGTELFTYAYAEGLDQEGRRLRNLPGTAIPPDESRSSEAGNRWRWTFEGRVFPDTARVAVAFRITFLRVAKRASATFAAPVQEPLSASQQAACGLVLEPFSQPGEQAPRVRVAALTPDSAAAESTLRPGDELLQVDGLPPSLWGRAMLRHRPGENLDILFRRGEQVYRAQVRLDRAAE